MLPTLKRVPVAVLIVQLTNFAMLQAICVLVLLTALYWTALLPTLKPVLVGVWIVSLPTLLACFAGSRKIDAASMHHAEYPMVLLRTLECVLVVVWIASLPTPQVCTVT